jgi:hypothetical protein
MKVVRWQKTDVLVHFKADVGVAPDVAQLFSKWVRMHIDGAVEIDKVHWDNLRVAVFVYRRYPAGRLAVEKVYHLLL